MKKVVLSRILLVLAFISIASIYTSVAQKNNFVPSKNDGWLVSIEEAYALSDKTDRPILANFTGSDWCGWCKKLKAEVFSKPEFKDWAKDNVVLLELDFPRRTKLPDEQARQNYELQKAFQVSGFPTIWVFDLKRPQDSKQFEIHAYGKTGYMQGGENAFIKNVQSMIAASGK